MVASKSFLRTSEDVGAPALQGNVPGSLIAVLKAVLVDGYGETPSLGWSVWLEDTPGNKIVFRAGNAHGILPFIRIDDGRTLGYTALVEMYESMSTIDVGLDPCPLPSSGEDRCILKRAYDNTNVTPWKIIGDDRGFWILVQAWPSTSEYDAYWEPHYIGEWTCNYAENKYNQMTILHNSDLNGYFHRNDDRSIHLLRNPVGNARGAVSAFVNTRFSNDERFGIYYSGSNPQEVNGRRFYEHTIILHNSNYFLGATPGMMSMIYEPDSGAAPLSESELEPIYDVVSDNTTLLTLPSRYEGYTTQTTQGANRITYIIGEGFRDAR